jgi:alpha-L-rhamnosidase
MEAHRVTRLRCEYRLDPIDVDQPDPRLAWEVETAGRGWRQTARQVMVATDRDLLTQGLADVWDSGRLEGDEPFIDYAGRSLRSREVLFWMVRVWDASGLPGPWSSLARFEMGLLDESDWGGCWIGRDASPIPQTVDLSGSRWIANRDAGSQVAFRGSLDLPVTGPEGVIKDAMLVVAVQESAAVCDVDVHCNGRYLAKAILGGGRPPLVVDPRALLRPGRNIISISVHAGSALPKVHIAAGVRVAGGNGHHSILLSDGAWLAALVRPDWNACVVDEHGWLSAIDAGPVQTDTEQTFALGMLGYGYLPAPHLRRSFLLLKPVVRARLYVVGLGAAECHINGGIVGNGIREPGPSVFNRRVLATAHDVAAMLRPGENIIGAILGTGWYDVHDEAVWFFHRAPWRGRSRLRLHLAVDHPDGTATTVLSDGKWTWSIGPVLQDGVYTGEVYDARQEIPGWDVLGAPPGLWHPVDRMDPPGGRIVFRPCPPVRVTRHLRPVAITRPRPGIQIADFCETFAGHVRLRVQAPRGTCIRLRYGEVLDACGMLERTSIDMWMTPADPPQAFQEDVFVCAGGGVESWEPRFSLHGFRYVEVTGCPADLTLDDLAGCYAHTDLESAGGFSCSHPIANQLQEATIRSYQSNAQGIPTDCPQREKNGWTGDVHLACEAGLLNFRSAPFYGKWLDDVADSQRENGGIPVIVPSSGWGDGLTWPGAINPAWDAAFHLVAWAVWRLGGDDRLLRRHARSLGRYVDYLWSQCQDGMPPGAILGDWLPWSETAPNRLVDVVYLAESARIAAVAARLIGDGPGGERFESIAASARSALNRDFLREGCYANGTQCAHALPLHYGLVPADQYEAVLRRLIDDVMAKGHVDAGILGAKSLLRVLAEGGRADLAWNCLVRTERPGWGSWIAQGATTLWEDWGGTQSRNHIMFGDISAWLMQWIAGIAPDPTVPGFARVLMQPQFISDLSWAEGWHHSPRGRITSSWKRDDAGISWEIMLPPGVNARAVLPWKPGVVISEGGTPLVDGTGDFVRCIRDKMMIELGSGRYRIHVS